jgi:hypothetical protein
VAADKPVNQAATLVARVFGTGSASTGGRRRRGLDKDADASADLSPSQVDAISGGSQGRRDRPARQPYKADSLATGRTAAEARPTRPLPYSVTKP